MKRAKNVLPVALLLGSLVVPVVTTGCAEHRYRVYDPYHSDYHYWKDEDPYYRRWYSENYHDQYRDYKKLNGDEQKRYWDWRHAQGHDHDHDRDHH